MTSPTNTADPLLDEADRLVIALAAQSDQPIPALRTTHRALLERRDDKERRHQERVAQLAQVDRLTSGLLILDSIIRWCR